MRKTKSTHFQINYRFKCNLFLFIDLSECHIRIEHIKRIILYVHGFEKVEF